MCELYNIFQNLCNKAAGQFEELYVLMFLSNYELKIIINQEATLKSKTLFGSFIFIIIFGSGLTGVYALYRDLNRTESIIIGAGAFILALVISSAIKIANARGKAVVLLPGHFHGLKGPGLFFIIPILDTIPYWIDTRVITTSFKAEKTLKKDTVTADVDAVLFWKVRNPQKAVLKMDSKK